MSFGTRLAEMRKLRKMTQAELGVGLGTDGKDVGKQVVYGWEKDQHFPRVDQLKLICQRLNCSADYLLFGETKEAKAVVVIHGDAKSISPEDRKRLRDFLDQPPVPDHEFVARAPAFAAPPGESVPKAPNKEGT